VEDATTLSWSSAAVSEWVNRLKTKKKNPLHTIIHIRKVVVWKNYRTQLDGCHQSRLQLHVLQLSCRGEDAHAVKTCSHGKQRHSTAGCLMWQTRTLITNAIRLDESARSRTKQLQSSDSLLDEPAMRKEWRGVELDIDLF